MIISNNNGGKTKIKSYEPKVGDADIEIKKYLPDMTEEQLLKILYNIFVDIQVAWMNFDYNTLKKDCTNELYNSYRSDLEVLKQKNGQNIMRDFECNKYNINGIIKENDIIIIKMFLDSSFYDYVIDSKTGNVTRGNSENKINNKYVLNFIAKKTDENVVCPSCGADVEKGLTECEYCHTIINHNYGDFVLSSKNKI